MKLHRISSAAFACVLLLSACQQGAENGANEDEEETPPVPVETRNPVRGDVFARRPKLGTWDWLLLVARSFRM